MDTKRAIAKRTIWAAVNEGLSSLVTMMVTVWIARETNAADFGAFAIAFAVARVAMGLTQGAGPLPMMVRTRNESTVVSSEMIGAVLGSVLLVSLACSGVLLLLTLISPTPSMTQAGWSFACALPGILLQQACISALYARRDQRTAVATNAVWVCTAALALTIVTILSPRGGVNADLAYYVLAYGASAYISAASASLWLGLMPNPRRGLTWLASNRASIIDLATSDTLSRATGQSTVWALGAVGGLQITAGLRAANTPLGIPRILLSGLSPAMLAEGTRMAAKHRRSLLMFIRTWSAVGLGLVVVVGLLFGLWSDELGPLVGGSSWKYAEPILPWVVLIAAANTVAVPASVGLNSLGLTRLAARVRIMTAPLPPLGTIVGGLVGGGHAAVAATAICMAIMGLAHLAVFEHAGRVVRSDQHVRSAQYARGRDD